MNDKHIEDGATYVDVKEVYKVIDETLKFVADNSTNPVIIRMTKVLYDALLYEINKKVHHFSPSEVEDMKED